MGDYAQHQQSNHQLKILLATLDNTLLHKINEFLFFGKKPKENHNDSNNLTLPTTITFQQLMIMLSYNLYIYIEVDLSYHNLNDEKIIHLTNELQNSNHGHPNTIEDIDLTDNYINGTGVISLSHFWYSQTAHIKSFYLGYNNIGNNGEKAIANILRKNRTQLEVLSLCSNNIDGGIAIAKALQTNTKLQLLNLHSNNISDRGVIEFSNVLAINTTLMFLDLDNNNIYDKSVIELANSLISNKNSSLESLSLADNYISEEGGIVLGKMISRNKKLSKLHLDRNRLGNRGVTSILLGMETNCSIKTLGLSSNDFNDTVAIAIADMFDVNSTLINLKLDFNDMTDFGAKSIFNILKYRGKVLKLKTLSCSYNQFTDAGINLLDQIMELVDNQITIYTFGNVNETPHVYTDSELEELKLKYYMVEK
eukprot:g10869.t1